MPQMNRSDMISCLRFFINILGISETVPTILPQKNRSDMISCQRFFINIFGISKMAPFMKFSTQEVFGAKCYLASCISRKCRFPCFQENLTHKTVKYD